MALQVTPSYPLPLHRVSENPRLSSVLAAHSQGNFQFDLPFSKRNLVLAARSVLKESAYHT